jgi:hypothetical protein
MPGGDHPIATLERPTPVVIADPNFATRVQ